MQSQETVRAFWAGPRLSPYEELSLLSFLKSGARVLLYSSDMTLQVPDGVELVNVHDILADPVHKYIYDDGDFSLAVYSDLFRYQVVQQHGGWYFDLDMVLLGTTLPADEIYIARENDNLINAAIMKFPAGSPFLEAATDEARRLMPKAGRLDIGPDLVTQLIEKQALGAIVKPRSRAYEVRTSEVLSLFDPDACEDLEQRVANSDFVHLWNEIWRRLRIPKNYGPPEGSFLDGLFKRHGMSFAADARLSLEALQNWSHTHNMLAWRQRLSEKPSIWRPDRKTPDRHIKAKSPQTVRTFWQADQMGPYQQMCLKSFVDRGHDVEVFTYDEKLSLPRWLRRRDAAEILDQDRALRYLPEHEQFAVHSNLLRHTLLQKYGDWWIDPDVVLLEAELPFGEFFMAGQASGNQVATAALKIPRDHPLTREAVRRCAALEENLSDWNDADLLARCVEAQSLIGQLQSCDLISPVPWSDVTSLLDPSRCDDILEQCRQKPFINLHGDVWLRAGIPDYLGPPAGSFMDRLFEQHDINYRFLARMQFSDVKRWLGHMYLVDRLQREKLAR